MIACRADDHRCVDATGSYQPRADAPWACKSPPQADTSP